MHDTILDTIDFKDNMWPYVSDLFELGYFIQPQNINIFISYSI